jgi:hypothetical protein
VAPTNAELAAAVTGVLTASRHFRQLYGRATPEQQAAVMVDFPWAKRSLELRELTTWARATVPALLSLEERPVRAVVKIVADRLAG